MIAFATAGTQAANPGIGAFIVSVAPIMLLSLAACGGGGGRADELQPLCHEECADHRLHPTDPEPEHPGRSVPREHHRTARK